MAKMVERGKLVIDLTASYAPRSLRVVEELSQVGTALDRGVGVAAGRLIPTKTAGRKFFIAPKNLITAVNPAVVDEFDLSSVNADDWLLFMGVTSFGNAHSADEVINLGSEPKVEVITMLDKAPTVSQEKGKHKVYETPEWLTKALFSRIGKLESVVDLTAGSGRGILAAFDSNENLKNTVLLGFELRELKPDDKRNQVFYGHNALHYFRGLNYSPAAFYFANPPYTTDGFFEKLYIQAVSRTLTGTVLLGVMSTKAIKYLKNSPLRGIAVVVPAKDIWGGTPEKVVLVAARTLLRNEKEGNIQVFEIDDDAKEAVIEAAQQVSQFAERYRQEVEEQIDGFSPPTYLRRRLKEIYKNGEELNRQDIEVIKANADKLFSMFSPVEQALSGEKIFPDLRIFNTTKMLSFKQVINDASLLDYYKNTAPAIFDFIQSVAEKGGYELAVSESRGKEFATTDRLGLVKFRYYPKNIDLTKDVVDVLREFVDSENPQVKEALEVAEKLAEKGGKLTVKSVMGGDSREGLSVMGYTPVLVLTDSSGLEHSAFAVSLSDFFRRLEEKGLINLSDKVEVIRESREEKEKIVRGFLKLIREVKAREQFKPTPQEIMEYFEILRSGDLVKLNEFIFARASEVQFNFPQLIKDPEFEKAMKKELKTYLASVPGAPKKVKTKFLKKLAEELESRAYSLLMVNRDETVEQVKNSLIAENPELNEEIAKEAARRIVDGATSEFTFLSAKRIGMSKMVQAIYWASLVESEYRKGNIDKAYNLLKDGIYGRIFGLRPHQVEESFRLLAKWLRTKEGGHILGWEMRSGKTLAMLNTALLAYAVTGRPVAFLPKTANLNDILLQMSEYLPLAVYFSEAYASGDTSPILKDDRTKTIPFGDLIPNPFFLARDKATAKMFAKAGKTVEEKLATYSQEIEELVERAEKLPNPLEAIDENSPLAFVAQLDAYSPAVRTALYWYLEGMRKRGELITSGRAFEKFKEKMLEKNEELKAELAANAAKEDFPIKVIPKSFGLAMDYSVSFSKNIKLGGLNFLLRRKVGLVETTQLDPQEYMGRVILPENFVLRWRDTEDVREEAGIPYSVELFKEVGIKLGQVSVAGYELVSFEEFSDAIKKDKRFISELEEEGKDIDREIETLYREVEKITARVSRKSGERLFKDLFLHRYKEFREEGEVELPVEFAVFPNPKKGTAVRVVVEERAEDDPSKVVRKNAAVRATVTYNAKTKNVLKVEIDDPNRPPYSESNPSNSKAYFIRRKALEGLGAFIVDEVDEATDPTKSTTYRAFHYCSKNALLKVGGTGTPTSGYPEDLVALSGLVAGMPIDAINETTGVVKELYSAWEFPENIKGDVGEMFYDIIVNNSIDDFKTLVSAALSSENPKSAGRAFLETYTALTVNPVKASYVEQILQDKTKVEIVGNIVRPFAERVSLYLDRINSKSYLLNLFLEEGVKSNIVKRAAGTLDPFGLVSILQGASFSFNTREQLKSAAAGREIKEKLEFDKEVLRNIGRAVREKAGLTAEFAPDSRPLRAYVDFEVQEELESDGVYEHYRGVQLLAEILQKWIEHRSERAAQLLGYDSGRTLKLIASKSTKSKDDSLKALIKEGAVKGLEGLKQEHEADKVALVWRIYQAVGGDAFRQEVTEFARELFETRFGGDHEKVEDSLEVLRKGLNGLRDLFNRPVGREITLYREEWKAVTKEGFEGFSFIWNPIGGDTQVVDAFSNAGYYEEINRLSREGESYLLTSARVEALKAALLDAVSAAYRARKEGKGASEEVVFLVRYTDDRIKEAVEALNHEELQRAGIKVKAFSTASDLDAESKRYKSFLLWQKEEIKAGKLDRPKVQLVVVSTDTAIARGVDLSHLDEIVCYGVTRNGKTAAQLFARLFNATDKNEGKVFLAGYPVRFFKMINGEVSVYPSSIFYDATKLLQKFEFVRATLSGDVANLLPEAERGKVLEGSSKEIVEKSLKREQKRARVREAEMER